MADDSVKNSSQESVQEEDMPAIVKELREYQSLIQGQATDFMDVLLDRTFLKLFKNGANDLSEEDKEQLGIKKETFLRSFGDIVGNSIEDIVNQDSIQYMLDEIMETSGKVTESPDYLEEVHPIRVDFLKKLKDFKEEMDESNETLSKEREAQYLQLKEEVKATKTIKSQLTKRLRKVIQEMGDMPTFKMDDESDE